MLARILRKVRQGDRTPFVPTTVEDYLRIQTVDALSFESEIPGWAEGQRRYLREISSALDTSWRILDCACGDGVGLEELRSLGVKHLVGVEVSAEKARHARNRGFQVVEDDMHRLSFTDGLFDAVISSHTLEHALDPDRALEEFRRVLKPDGMLHVVLPFPDTNDGNRHVHVAKDALGTSDPEGADRVIGFFVSRGFALTSVRRDSVREPEIWLGLRREAR
jgi:SAM-dependent methyltransferase